METISKELADKMNRVFLICLFLAFCILVSACTVYFRARIAKDVTLAVGKKAVSKAVSKDTLIKHSP